jgi:hypothetical protein
MQIVSLSLLLFAVIVIVLGIVAVHTYPAKIARQRGHPQAKAIEVCSLLGLIVFPLWMAALIWAYAGVVGTPVAFVAPVAPVDVADDEAAASEDPEPDGQEPA